MRIRVERDGLSVHAIAGTEVVLFGLDLPEAMAEQLLGFGIERIADATGERTPLRGLKTFAATEPADHRPGDPVSTLAHPVQAFLWGDYVVEPDTDYTYRVVALGGTPERLDTMAEVLVPVQTEAPHRGTHGVWFNRGAAASQAYARQFRNRHPDRVAGRRAWAWLSRGLEEALLTTIGRAGPGDALRAAVYEFSYPPVLAAFRAAAHRGVDVRIVMDAKRNEAVDPATGERGGSPRDTNLDAVVAAGLDDLVTRREANRSDIAHNKFVVHLRDGQPVSVWTGSTNITRGGIFGHSNVGHLVRDPSVATRYLAYWEQLAADPDRSDLCAWNELTALPAGKPPRGITTVFGPRASLAALDWYAGLMDRAEASVFLTAAFGISGPIEAVLLKEVDHLRYGLLERADDKMELLKRDRDNVFTVATRIRREIGGWAQETLADLNGHVHFVHTKFLLIDPLSEDPIVITGSANFSKPSTNENDENMLVIRGNTRVADVYLTEFMRLFNHFEFRERVQADQAGERGPELAGGRTSAAAAGEATMASGEPTTQRRFHLDPEPGWALEHYTPGWQRTKERELFR